jgi:hypothetical protein
MEMRGIRSHGRVETRVARGALAGSMIDDVGIPRSRL